MLNDNPIPLYDHERTYNGTCDLCLESVSDSTKQEVERDTKVKKREYEFAGVCEYYILGPADAHMGFYRRNANGFYDEIHSDSNGVIQSEVLKGFQFRRSDLFSQPSLEDLAKDEVYQGFILPEFQSALEQIEQEKQRVEQEKQRAEKLAAKLLELGMDPDQL